jgi:glycerol uptake facilitator protein
MLATCVLVFLILMIATKENTPVVGLGSIGAFPVTAIIMALGMSLGGTTGYAMNPARDLGPRCIHALIPLKEKRDSGWSYSWVPVLGPLTGGALAAVLFLLIF